MKNIYISGSNGFLGKSIIGSLGPKYNFIKVDLRNNCENGIHKNELESIFLHLANNHSSVDGNLDLSKKTLEYCKYKNIKNILLPLSFVTLHGTKTVSEFNLGYRPTYLNPYACTKLSQEKYFFNYKNGLNVKAFYLPAILGPKSNWNEILENLDKEKTTYFKIKDSASFNYCELNKLIIEIENYFKNFESYPKRNIINHSQGLSLTGYLKSINRNVSIRYEGNFLKRVFFEIVFRKSLINSFLIWLYGKFGNVRSKPKKISAFYLKIILQERFID